MGTTTIPEERRYLGKDKLKTVLTKVKEKLAGKVDKVSGKQLSTNDYTTAEKNKLAGIAAGANNYSHPAYTARTGVPTADAKPGFGGTFQVSQPVSDSQGHITAVNTRNITIPNAAATTSAAGLMSSTDKTKLDGIEAGAQKNTVTGIKGNAESSYRTGNVNLTPANIGAAAASHTHSIGNVTNLQAALDGKAASNHTHAISNITNLQTTLDGKAAKSHEHSASEITSGTLSMERIADKSITKEKLADGIFTDTDNILISTIYIDQTITDPASMISGDINGAAIQAIRANSHRFLGKYTANGTMTICQLSDTDSTKFADGSAADLTGAQGDVFMRLPVFYTQATELSTDKWMIRFVFGGKPNGEGWMKWGGNDLIGVYEGFVTGSKLYSVSGVIPSTNISYDDFVIFASNRGAGYSLTKWRTANLIAFINMAIYGTTNIQGFIGCGSNNSVQATGTTNILGMTDTSKWNGNSISNNCIGIENWTANIYEYIDNVLGSYSNLEITEDDGSTRVIKSGLQSNGWRYGTKILIGDHLDIVFVADGGTSSTGFTDAQYFQDGNQRIRRGAYNANDEGGFFCFRGNKIDNQISTAIGGRLSFTGNITVQNNSTIFKSLTAIG